MAEIRDSIKTPMNGLCALADKLADRVLASDIREIVDALQHEILDMEVSLEDAQFDMPYDDGLTALDLAEQLAEKLRAHPQDTVRRVCDCLLAGQGSDLWQVLG